MITTKSNTTPAKQAYAGTAAATPVTAKISTAPVRPAAKPAAAKRVMKSSASPVKATVSTPVKTAPTKVPPKTPTDMAAVKAAPAKVNIKAVAQPKAEKPARIKKKKLVRDSFTIPKTEYTVLEDLKQRAGKLASSVKKSELIRAGIKALAAMPDSSFLAALKAVPAIKTGRPTKTEEK